MSEEPMPLRVDYRKITPTCYVCDAPSTIVRFTQATDGEVYVSTLCATHAAGEQQHIMDEGVLQPVEGTGTFINIDLYEQLEALDGVEELRDAMRNIESSEGAEEKPDDAQA